MPLTLRPMDEASARTILSWRYDPPYDIYNLDPEAAEEDVQFLLDPQNAYYCMRDEQNDLVAFCCFGPDARVPGGDYSAGALDIGMGVRPDLTGRGQGHTFAGAVLDFASRTFRPPMLRVTVAEFNRRALRVWEQAGFQGVQTFQKSGDGMPFVILFRTV